MSSKRYEYPYLLQIRLYGKAKEYTTAMAFDVARKFNVKGITRNKVKPHITFFGPFKTSDEKLVARTIKSIGQHYDLVPYSIDGFNRFNNRKHKVIYLDIHPSDEIKEFRYHLSKELRSITNSISHHDRLGKDQFPFHATIAFKDIDYQFEKIWSYLKTKEKPHIEQYLLRISFLRKGKILYEYDLLQKRLLSRKQSMNHHLFTQTLQILQEKIKKQDLSGSLEKIRTEKRFWTKLRSLFKGING